MRTQIECIACKVRQAADLVKRATGDQALQEKVIKKILDMLSSLSFSRSPVSIRRDIERVAREMLGSSDTYSQHKKLSNEIGLKFYPQLKQIAAESKNPLKTAIRLAAIGNIIDFGMFTLDEINEERVEKLVNDSLDTPSLADDSNIMISRLKSSKDIWYIADNCGELFFDRVLIEHLPIERITVVVRGKPILNDATLADAKATGLTDIVRVIDDGYDAPALILDECRSEIRDGFFKADLVIAKGQGNYEALSDIQREIFFLLMVKCEVVARNIGCNVGDLVIKRIGG